MVCSLSMGALFKNTWCDMRQMGLAVTVIGICLLGGCIPAPAKIFIPTEALTEEQKIAIAQEDAESCNCGRGHESSSACDD